MLFRSVGPDGSYLVEGIGASEPPANLHRDVIDAAERVSDADSFAMVKRLVREEGLLVGISSGAATWAAVQRVDPLASHASWMENFPWTRLDGVPAPEERKPMVDVAALRQHIASLSLFLHQHPPRVTLRLPFQRGIPDDAVPLVNEITQRKTVPRQFLHVVGE